VNPEALGAGQFCRIGDDYTDILFWLYLVLSAIGLIFAAVLIFAPLILYEISRELKKLNETTSDQTWLLAAVANATNPIKTTVERNADL
jgi:hypothetical protein